MPLPKKLDCEDTLKIVSQFFSGISVKELANHYQVSRVVISRIIGRTSYKDCTLLNVMVNALGLSEYFLKVDTQMEANKRIGRGNKRSIT